MAFGAFAPMPLRLGGSPEEGWASSQHARAAADLVAAVRAMPLAVLTLERAGSVCTVTKYHGQNGVGLAHAPTVTEDSAGVFSVEWAKGYRTERYVSGTREDEDRSWVIRQGQVSVLDSVPQSVFCEVTAGALVVTFGADTGAVVEVWGSWIPLPQIGTYGGDPNKEDSATEGDVPYAAVIYTDLQGMRGSAYTTKTGTLVHVENLALARFLGYHCYRLPEKVRANAVPSRSDERLPYWVEVLKVRSRVGDENWLLRQRASAAYRVSTGPIHDTVEASLQSLLGENFVEMSLEQSDPLDTPPPPTKWPGVDPGEPSYDIGGGPWYSKRCHLVVLVQQLPGQSQDAFLRLVNVDLFAMLDNLLPSTMTFNWTTSTSDGFLLDVSDMDFDGFD